MTIEEQYEAHERLIYERAWYWSKKTGRDDADLLGICHAAFMETWERWQPDGGAKFSSLLATLCNQRIMGYLKRIDEVLDTGEDELYSEAPSVYALLSWKETLEALGPLARDCVTALLESPGRIYEAANGSIATPTNLRQALRRVLWRDGWEEEAVDIAFAELKKTVAS